MEHFNNILQASTKWVVYIFKDHQGQKCTFLFSGSCIFGELVNIIYKSSGDYTELFDLVIKLLRVLVSMTNLYEVTTLLFFQRYLRHMLIHMVS